MKKNSLQFLALALAFCCTLAMARDYADESMVRCRGKYLRTEILHVEEVPLIECQLVVKNGMPGLKIGRQIRRTSVGVKMYESLIQTVGSDGILSPGSNNVRYIVDEGKEIPGEEVEDVEYRRDGVCRNQIFVVNGRTVVTDDEGVIVDWPGDEGIGILEYFDKQENLDLQISISGKGMQHRQLTIFRRMPQRRENDEKNLVEPPERELLNVYGLNFLPGGGEPERKALDVTVKTRSNIILPNVPFEIEVSVRNNGSKSTSCLAGRIFSRLPWLNGRWFYFGAVKPGETLKFKRYVVADRADLVDRAFGELRFRDSYGNLPELSRQFDLNIEK